jgi:zinc D-Ala-D-Ala carboxypeptidase
VRISPHFRLEEFAVSHDHPALVRAVPPRCEGFVRKLADLVLEPARAAIGVPFEITSGFRSIHLNAAVGGSATSQHLWAQAADVELRGRPALALFDWYRARAAEGAPLPHGQLVWYPDRGFVHVALASDRHPGPTFCVHLPARGFRYHVVTPTTSVAHLAGLRA